MPEPQGEHVTVSGENGDELLLLELADERCGDERKRDGSLGLQVPKRRRSSPAVACQREEGQGSDDEKDRHGRQ